MDKFSSSYFLENSPRYSADDLLAYVKGQSPEIVEEIKESLKPLFRRLYVISESKKEIGVEHIDSIYEKVAEWRESGVSDDFLEAGVTLAIVEGFGDKALDAVKSAAGALTNGGGVTHLLGNLFSQLKGGMFQMIKQAIAKKLLGMLGLDPSHGLAKYIAIALSEVGVFELPKLFTDCRFLVRVLASAIPNFVAQSTQLGDSVVGSFVSVIFSRAIRDAKFVQGISNSMADTVCTQLGQLGASMAQNAGTIVSKLKAKSSGQGAAPQPAALPQAQ